MLKNKKLLMKFIIINKVICLEQVDTKLLNLVNNHSKTLLQ